MHEYPVIDSAVSVDQLRLRLKDGELEQYGDAFVPEFVYEVIRRLPRFSTMRVSIAIPSLTLAHQKLARTSARRRRIFRVPSRRIA